MKILAIATIPGDGIGKEVIPGRYAGAGRLAAADGGFAFDFDGFRLERTATEPGAR